jgi:DNA-binding sugar fermentation-stimulating protein
MILNNIYETKFIERQNRFVGKGILNNQEILFHIGDTGRLAELLFP